MLPACGRRQGKWRQRGLRLSSFANSTAPYSTTYPPKSHRERHVFCPLAGSAWRHVRCRVLRGGGFFLWWALDFVASFSRLVCVIIIEGIKTRGEHIASLLFMVPRDDITNYEPYSQTTWYDDHHAGVDPF